MDAQTAKTIIGHDRALFLFTVGWLVVAEDMAARLVSSGYFVDEKALLDPASEPRRKGLPVIEVAGVAGLFFRPSAVLAFMKSQGPPHAGARASQWQSRPVAAPEQRPGL